MKFLFSEWRCGSSSICNHHRGQDKNTVQANTFWGSGAEINGRKIVIQMNEFVDNTSVPITSIITFDEVVPDTTESSYTYGVVSGLLKKNAYTFALASQNGDSDARRSSWTNFRIECILLQPFQNLQPY